MHNVLSRRNLRNLPRGGSLSRQIFLLLFFFFPFFFPLFTHGPRKQISHFNHFFLITSPDAESHISICTLIAEPQPAAGQLRRSSSHLQISLKGGVAQRGGVFCFFFKSLATPKKTLRITPSTGIRREAAKARNSRRSQPRKHDRLLKTAENLQNSPTCDRLLQPRTSATSCFPLSRLEKLQSVQSVAASRNQSASVGLCQKQKQEVTAARCSTSSPLCTLLLLYWPGQVV